MSSIIDSAFDSKNFRENGHKMVDLLADYFQNVSTQQVLKYEDPEALYEKWRRDMKSGEPQGVVDFIQKIIEDSIHLHHPKYLGHQTSVISPFSTLAEFAGGLLDPGMGVYEQGTAGVVLERLISKELAVLIGWGADADGFLTSGGTLGNLTCMLCARQAMTETDVWEEGYGNQQYAFLASEEAHFSVSRATRVMGMGAKGIVPVPVNNKLQMRADLLEGFYASASEKGIRIIGVVGSACSTASGSYDPLNDIADFCEEKNLWFHVDGAHGAGVLFSSKYRHLLNGIDRADSVIIDFHKMLMTPKLVTAVLFRKAAHSYQTFSQKASYLWDKDEGKEWYNLARRTFELTKSFMSIKVYALWRTFGSGLFEEYVNRQYDLARSFARLIAQQSDFEILLENPESNIVCFRYSEMGWDEQEKESFNIRVREAITKDGEFFIVQTRIKGSLYLRTTLMNPYTTEKELEGLLQKIRLIRSTGTLSKI